MTRSPTKPTGMSTWVKILLGLSAMGVIIAAVIGIVVGAQHHGQSTAAAGTPSSSLTQGSCSKKGLVYDYFYQYCPTVTLTNSSYWLNFDAGFDSSCTDPNVIARHQPMVVSPDRIHSSYDTILSLPSYAMPAYLLTFNEPNYIYSYGTSNDDTNALNNNVSTSGAWDAIHALSYHTYATNFESIVNETTSLYEQFGKPIWVTEIASGSNSTMEANVQLMEAFVPWANNQSWIERYFWNQAGAHHQAKPQRAAKLWHLLQTPPESTDPNIQNSYMVNESVGGKGNGTLTPLGQTYTSITC
ncbi:MAG: hypothetical protein FRX49_10716 [Trebouxia sp. A1-2]|nr:MAG: hypothetical protein FRX49_10716 [Trebouxia sp. A1-2]